MTATIQLQFQFATTTSTTCTITVSNGSFALTANEFLSFNGTVPFSTLNLSTGSISIYNPTPGTSLSGGVTIPVTGTGNGYPTIAVNNFSGPATISWPSADGLQSQSLMSGDPVALDGFNG